MLGDLVLQDAMKTIVLSVAALIGLFAAAVTVLEAEVPIPSAQASPRVIRIGEMSVERAAHQATLLETDQVLITGGCADQCDSVHASVALYDPATEGFRSVASMATPRVSHAAIALPDGRVLVVGGWTGQRATASAEIYDTASGRWTTAGDMTAARISPIATPLPNGSVLITGGEAEVGAPLASAEVFDPETSTFSAVSPMLAPRMSHVAVPLSDGRVLIAGGHRARGEVLRSAEIFDPATGKFRPTGDMLAPRHKHAAALLGDGRVLLAGGSSARDYEGRYRTTEIYDPATDEFSPGPAMRLARHKIRDAVVVLPSGRVMVAGGATRPEIYDPAERAFVPVAESLSGPPMFATATLLSTGDVLVLGGYDDRIQSSASAWLVRLSR